jgi:hypothetical protein
MFDLVTHPPKVRRLLLANGYVPLCVNGKVPPIEKWPDIIPTEAMIAEWEVNEKYSSARNTGIVCRGVRAVDIDVYDPDLADILHAKVVALIPPGAPVLVRTGQPPKRAILFRTDETFPKTATGRWESPDGRRHQVEVLADRQQLVVFGIHPETRGPYRWQAKGCVPWEVPRARLPTLTEEDASRLVADATALFRAQGWKPPREPPPAQAKPPRTAMACDGDAHRIAQELAEHIADLCAAILPGGVRHGHEWRVGSIDGEGGESLGVHLTGQKAGVWSDFATGEKGDALELVKAVKRFSTTEAMDWSRDWLRMPARSTLPKERHASMRTGQETGDARTWQQSTFTGADLKNTSFEPLAFLVRNIIPLQGVTLLCSKPKFGKSWLAYDLCIGCAADRFILGEIKPAQGDVLYLALEDSKRRLRARMDKLLTPGGKWPERLTMATEWRRLHEGGLDDIRAWHAGVVAKGGQPILVMIDVLAKVRRPVGNRQLYEADYDALTGLCKLANDLGLAIVVVHHTRKMAADDLMETVSGSFGVSGAADAILVMANKTSGTVLDIRGRDVESAELAIEFNKPTCRWRVLGDAGEVHISEQRGKIIGALKEADAPMTVPALNEATGIKRNALELTLGRMAKDGEIKRLSRGLYAHKDYTPPDPEDPESVRSVSPQTDTRQKADRSQAAENEGKKGQSVQSVQSVSVGTDGDGLAPAGFGNGASVPAQTDQTERQIAAQGIEIAPGFTASESVTDLSRQTDWTEAAYPDFPDSLRRRCDACGGTEGAINSVHTATGTAYLHPDACEQQWLRASVTLGSS